MRNCWHGNKAQFLVVAWWTFPDPPLTSHVSDPPGENGDAARPDNCALIDFMNDTVVEVYNCHNEDPWLSDPSVPRFAARSARKPRDMSQHGR